MQKGIGEAAIGKIQAAEKFHFCSFLCGIAPQGKDYMDYPENKEIEDKNSLLTKICPKKNPKIIFLGPVAG